VAEVLHLIDKFETNNIEVVMMLCDKCLPMLQSSSEGEHHPDLASFTSSAAQGCYICKPLLRSLLKKCETTDNFWVKPFKYFVLESDQKKIIFKVTVFQHGQEREIRIILLVVRTTITLAVDLRQRKREIPFLTAAQISHRWMTDCLREHSECPNNKQPNSYPTRLLELGGSDL
jgi:hypothetical protein